MRLYVGSEEDTHMIFAHALKRLKRAPVTNNASVS
jgi:hypothetical protein